MHIYKGKHILVFGLGLNGGGVGSALFFAKQGATVKVTDLKNKEILKPSLDQLKDFPIQYTLGEHKNEDIDWADLIIKNPAVKPKNPYIEYALKNRKRVETDIGIFLEFVKPSQIVGVTGTKGKSTTASLIFEVLKKGGKDVLFAGNIGRSVLELLTIMLNSSIKPERLKPETKNNLIVLELSSFQLEAFDQYKVSPKWAVITNIYPDHLNYYKNMDEYISAKKLIAKFQTSEDFLFINKEDPTINEPQFLEGLRGEIIFYSISDIAKDFKPHLLGEHNRSNIAAALAVCKTFGIDETAILRVLKKFKGVPFRMDLVKVWEGVKIINDTTATGPDSGIQALETFPNSILICGGMNKGMNYKEFSKKIDQNAKKVFFLEGDSTNTIISSLRAQRSNLKIDKPYHDLEKLLTDVKTIAKSGDTILFSPAATSFNLFQNEFDRGRKFNEAVEKIFS